MNHGEEPMRPKQKRNGRKGFTLLEVIVGLVVLAVMAAMLVTFMGTGVVQSANPVLLAQNGAYINQIVENMSADYKYLMSTDPTPLATFGTRVGGKNSSQTRYSDLNHPYTIVDNDRISFPTGSDVTEQPDGSGKILKVTVRYQGLTLTALFSE